MSHRLSAAIIGAGAAGLTAAWDLSRAGLDVEVFEAESAAGGLAAGFRDENWDWSLEKFYHHWFETDTEAIKLAGEIGFADKVLFPRPRTSYWINGKIYRSEMNASTLKLPLSPFSLFRLGLAGVYLKFITKNWRALEQVTAHDWMRRYMGEEAYNRLWRPLLIGKFADRYQDVNMAWMWARIYTRSVRLGIFEGGFQAFMDALADAVRGRSGVIHFNTPVQVVRIQDGKPALTVGGQTRAFDRVISTTSPALMLRLTPDLRETPYGRQMADLQSIGAICVVLALKQSVLTDGTYWLNLPATSADKRASEFPFLALVEHTNWLDKKHYNGDVLVYCGDYVPPDHEYFQMSDDDLVARFLPALKKVNPAFSPDWIRKTWVWRAPYAQPVPGVRHSQKIPPLTTPLPGIIWASMSQVYPWDRGTNYAILIGREAAKLALPG
ncbi:MAG: FAD-dependent oxidoreductase [Chloroflexi bacterium]|nr:FAD-dependent oxidoreductase [Chloroflexota bacterium]MDL1882936.1 NAD(P)/FAD-dependent oxidoreductase [Anaerolineae bacterium CFX8]